MGVSGPRNCKLGGRFFFQFSISADNAARASSVVFINPTGLNPSDKRLRKRDKINIPVYSLQHSTKDNAESDKFVHVEIMRRARGR
jgi:hypothetical protein